LAFTIADQNVSIQLDHLQFFWIGVYPKDRYYPMLPQIITKSLNRM